jgi:N-formylglutamate deformylase
MEPFRFRAGTVPLVVSMPHVGTQVPQDLADRFTPEARLLPDTDWHVDRLYDFLDAIGASVIVATLSRYVIDLNRPPDDADLYPGQDTTRLLPIDTFASVPIYRPGAEPAPEETPQRLARFWRPYHDRLAWELTRLRETYGYALLWDAHSIASSVPRLFAGRLPDLNLGTGNGTSCDPRLTDRLLASALASGYSAVLNGRFKGGYITRRYGRPRESIHAVQLELGQRTYMDESPPYAFREDLASAVRPHLRQLIEVALAWGREHAESLA